MIQLNNLQLGYAGRAVVSLPPTHVPQGTKCLITGPSGAGKTTLLYALAGLGEVLTGDVLVANTNLYNLNSVTRDHFRGQHIGMVFQTLHLIKSLSVLDNILLSSFLGQVPQDKIWAQQLLETLGIGHLTHQAVTNISQGQAQRVAIARALINKPKLLLADEPTSSLDDVAANQVLDLLSNLATQTGATLVVSSHDARIKNAFTQQIILGAAA